LAYFGHQSPVSDRRAKLEAYLKRDREHAELPFEGYRNVVHLMATLKLTEEQVLQACFQSPHISCEPFAPGGRAVDISYRYEENPEP